MLGKSDFNAVLKWRKKLRDAHTAVMKEQQPEEKKQPKPELTPEEKAGARTGFVEVYFVCCASVWSVAWCFSMVVSRSFALYTLR